MAFEKKIIERKRMDTRFESTCAKNAFATSFESSDDHTLVVMIFSRETFFF